MRPVSAFAEGPGCEIEQLRVTCMAGGGRPPGGDGAAVAARIGSGPDRRAAGVPVEDGLPKTKEVLG